jgi:hypothetical protein
MEEGSKRCDINQNVSKAGKNNKSDIQWYCIYILFIFHINTFNNYGMPVTPLDRSKHNTGKIDRAIQHVLDRYWYDGDVWLSPFLADVNNTSINSFYAHYSEQIYA